MTTGSTPADVRQSRLVVLEVLGDPNAADPNVGFNPYTAMTVTSLPTDRIEARYFDWKFALFGKYDALHLHWPEYLVRHKSRSRRAVKRIAALVLMTRLHYGSVAVVRTVHNEAPHESGGGFERWFLQRVDRITTVWVVLNESTKHIPRGLTHVVPHGHYKGWYPEPSSARISGRILTFGIIRPYKQTDELIRAFAGVSDPNLALRIAGRPGTVELGEEISQLAASDPRVSLDLRHIPDSELVEEIAQSEAVIFPYREFHNSGAALLALSFSRPIVVPATPATLLLQREFGAAWVALFDGSIDAEKLQDALGALRKSHQESTPPDLSGRDWPHLGELLARAIEEAVALRSCGEHGK